MDKINNDQTQKPHQDVQGGKKDESSNSIGHEDYYPILIGGWNLFSVSLGTKNFILNSIKRSNHFQFPLVHEGWRGHRLKGKISTTSIGEREQIQGGVMESLKKNKFYLLFFLERRNECVRGEFVVMCEELLFMESNGV